MRPVDAHGRSEAAADVDGVASMLSEDVKPTTSSGLPAGPVDADEAAQGVSTSTFS